MPCFRETRKGNHHPCGRFFSRFATALATEFVLIVAFGSAALSLGPGISPTRFWDKLTFPCLRVPDSLITSSYSPTYLHACHRTLLPMSHPKEKTSKTFRLLVTSFGSSQTWLFQSWLFLRSLARFCALLCSFARVCALWRAFGLFCVFLRLTAFKNDRVWELRNSILLNFSQRFPIDHW